MEAKGLFLVYFNAFDRNFYDDLLGIIDLHWKLNIVDVSVVIKPSQDSQLILMYSYFPFSHHHCFGRPPVVINQYVYGEWLRGGYFFPEKDSNMFGCPLVVATWEDVPYVRMAVDRLSTSKKIVPQGIEGRMYEYFSYKLNFKMTFYWVEFDDQELALAINETFYDEVGCFLL